MAVSGDELDTLRKERMRRLMAEQARAEEQQAAEEERLQREIEALEGRVKRIMTKEALQRYGTVKLAHPELAMTALLALAQSIERGLVNRVSDELLKKVLQNIQGKKRDIRITRK